MAFWLVSRGDVQSYAHKYPAADILVAKISSCGELISLEDC